MRSCRSHEHGSESSSLSGSKHSGRSVEQRKADHKLEAAKSKVLQEFEGCYEDMNSIHDRLVHMQMASLEKQVGVPMSPKQETLSKSLKAKF